MYTKCDKCYEWGNGKLHLHIEDDVEGLLEAQEYSFELREADIKDGMIAYRYVWSPADLFTIASNHLIASKARCMCLECLKYSLSFIPHYGDGAYCTLNENLKHESPRVIHTHGIDIRGMNYRVVLRIRDTSNFKIIRKTAGVIKSTPFGQKFYEGDLVFSDESSVKIILFQKWNGRDWEDVLLEDLKEVS